MPSLRPETPTYKELCRDNYSITKVIHRDGKVPKAPRGYSPDWFLGGKLEKRAGIMINAKLENLPKFRTSLSLTVSCVPSPSRMVTALGSWLEV